MQLSSVEFAAQKAGDCCGTGMGTRSRRLELLSEEENPSLEKFPLLFKLCMPARRYLYRTDQEAGLH